MTKQEYQQSPTSAEMSDETFTCEECGHELPIAYRHEEKPSVCFLDYVSESDHERIEQAIAEAEQVFNGTFCFTCNRAPYGAIGDCRKYGHRLSKW